jgi:photosystem II stability/assembly factor-like uncharacterized protein
MNHKPLFSCSPQRQCRALAARLAVTLFCGSALWSVQGMAAAQSVTAVLPATGPLSAKTMSRLLLTDGARMGHRVVAVGDRGYIVWSDSNGESWERAQTPPNLPLLNAVFFSDAKNGWAVGHDAVILHSADEGKTWALAFSAPSEQKPLMDILFLDALRGFAVGAYGAFYETADGGKTWNARKIGEGDKHLNAIIKLGDNRLLIVGEAGTIMKSDDAGKSWSSIASPYPGSFFGAIQAQDGAVLIYGLRGRIFRSRDVDLRDWAPIDSKSTASIMGATRLPDGALVLAGLSGTVLVSRDNGQSFVALPTRSTKAIAAPLLGAPNALLLFGEAGANDVLLPSASGAALAPAAPAKK